MKIVRKNIRQLIFLFPTEDLPGIVMWSPFITLLKKNSLFRKNQIMIPSSWLKLSPTKSGSILIEIIEVEIIKTLNKFLQSELNTDKPIPLIPPIIVDNYMHLLIKDIKGGYFLPLPPKQKNILS